jgi:hypothetical protein
MRVGASDGAADFQAVDLWQHNVEDEHIELIFGSALEGFATVADMNAVAHDVLQLQTDQLCEIRVVFDQKYFTL